MIDGWRDKMALSDKLYSFFMRMDFFGGTGILIIVGVMLDTIKQIESHLLTHHYEGFIKSGRIKGRR